MNWIRKEKRLAIYLRDGMACCYCSASVEDGAKLTLDHVKPHSSGGSNKPTNLVTACISCNSSRQDKLVKRFAPERVEYIREACRRDIDVMAAKLLIARRGGFSSALKNF